jgi:hypothetical protein
VATNGLLALLDQQKSPLQVGFFDTTEADFILVAREGFEPSTFGL